MDADFFQKLFCIYWDVNEISTLQFVNIMYYIDL